MPATIIVVLAVTSLAIVGFIFSIIVLTDCSVISKFISALIAIAIIAGLWLGSNYYYTNTARGLRKSRDYKSNISLGVDRTVSVMEDDGNVIYTYSGKIDIETNNDNYILFDDEEGKRHIIYKGATQMILVEDN